MNKKETTVEKHERLLVEFENNSLVKLLRSLDRPITREIYVNLALFLAQKDNLSPEDECRLPEALRKDFPENAFRKLFAKYASRPPVAFTRSEYMILIYQLGNGILKIADNDLQSNIMNLDQTRIRKQIQRIVLDSNLKTSPSRNK